jgi:hypothetical protein
MTKKLLFLCLISLFIFSSAYSQVYKYRAKQVAFKSKNDYGRWTDWTEWDDCDILTVINLEKNKFTIYSKETQEFDVVKIYPKEYDENEVEVFRLLVVDKNGLRCNIRQRFVKSEYYHSQLYVDYADLMYVYNLVFN